MSPQLGGKSTQKISGDIDPLRVLRHNKFDDAYRPLDQIVDPIHWLSALNA